MIRWIPMAALAGISATLVLIGSAVPSAVEKHFANADDDAVVLHGKTVYLHNCASCHGRSLQGQPLWQLIDEFAGRRAPAHDQTGHTWQHSDEDLFRFTKDGRWSETDSATLYMPAFGNRLSDADIEASLAFIKRSWPLGLRVSQAMLNPDRAGMPAHSEDVDWRFPPTTCRGSRRFLETEQKLVGVTAN